MHRPGDVGLGSGKGRGLLLVSVVARWGFGEVDGLGEGGGKVGNQALGSLS